MRAAVAAFALLAVLPTLARAAVPGMNLSWSTCGMAAITGNFSFTCDDNTLTRNLIASYRLAQNTPDFVGVSIVLDYWIGNAGTAWFQFGPGGCREGSFAPIDVGTISGCTNPYAGANQAGGFVNEPQGPNRWRVRADWARDTPAAQTAYTLYAAVVLQLNTVNSFDEGFGACAGCEDPACFFLSHLQVFTASSPGIYEHVDTAGIRNWASYQSGGVGCGCPCELVPTRNSTWGSLKALYR